MYWMLNCCPMSGRHGDRRVTVATGREGISDHPRRKRTVLDWSARVQREGLRPHQISVATAKVCNRKLKKK